jgi:hypothetical protein
MDVHASDVDGDPDRAMAVRNGSLPMHASDSDGRTIASVATAPRELGTALSGPRVGKADRPMSRAADGFGDADALGIEPDSPAEGWLLDATPRPHTGRVDTPGAYRGMDRDVAAREQPTTEA